MVHLEDLKAYLAVDFLGFRVDGKLWPFFSTIYKNLEKEKWGNNFPTLLIDLCDNARVEPVKFNELKNELEIIKNAFNSLKIKDVFLDLKDETKRVENEYQLNDLAIKYFTMKSGKNIFEIFDSAINIAQQENKSLEIKTLLQ